MIILESWKYYEVDIFKLTDNMSDKFIMWLVTLSRDPGSSLLSSSRREIFAAGDPKYGLGWLN